MKIENFHRTISIYSALPWFHTWPSHTASAIFASALYHRQLAANVSHELKITVCASEQQAALRGTSQRKVLYGTL